MFRVPRLTCSATKVAPPALHGRMHCRPRAIHPPDAIRWVKVAQALAFASRLSTSDSETLHIPPAAAAAIEPVAISIGLSVRLLHDEVADRRNLASLPQHAQPDSEDVALICCQHHDDRDDHEDQLPVGGEACTERSQQFLHVLLAGPLATSVFPPVVPRAPTTGMVW